MTDKPETPGYPVALHQYKDEYYLFIHELGIIAHDSDLNIAHKKLEEEKEALLAKFAEAGREFPKPIQMRRPWGVSGFGWVGALLLLVLLLAATFVGVRIFQPAPSGGDVQAQVKPLFDNLGAGIIESIENLQTVVQGISRQLKKSAFSNYWAVEHGGNGHYYKVISRPEGVTWDKAKKAAEEMGGYLAGIGGAAENDFVFGLFEEDANLWTKHGPYKLGPWIGGYREAGGDGWKWLDNEAFDFSNWSDGHPVESPEGKENRINFFHGNKWISNRTDYKLNSFVVEFDSKSAGKNISREAANF